MVQGVRVWRRCQLGLGSLRLGLFCFCQNRLSSKLLSSKLLSSRLLGSQLLSSRLLGSQLLSSRLLGSQLLGHGLVGHGLVSLSRRSIRCSGRSRLWLR